MQLYIVPNVRVYIISMMQFSNLNVTAFMSSFGVLSHTEYEWWSVLSVYWSTYNHIFNGTQHGDNASIHHVDEAMNMIQGVGVMIIFLQ